MRGEEIAAEAVGVLERLARVARHVAPGIAVALHDTDEVGMRVTAEFSALRAGPMRNGALLRKIGGVSQKMLTQTLRDLECNGLVARKCLETVPPYVEYRLTPLGKSLSESLAVLDRWAERNFPQLDASRARFRATQRATARR